MVPAALAPLEPEEVCQQGVLHSVGGREEVHEVLLVAEDPARKAGVQEVDHAVA